VQSGGSQQKGADLKCDVPDLLLEVVDLKQEAPDLRAGGIPLNLTHDLCTTWHSCAAVDKMSTDIARRELRLRQQNFLFHWNRDTDVKWLRFWTKHLTVESHMVIYASNSCTYYY